MKRIGFKVAFFYALVVVSMIGLMSLESMIVSGLWFGIAVWISCVVLVVVGARKDWFADVYDWHDKIMTKMFAD